MTVIDAARAAMTDGGISAWLPADTAQGLAGDYGLSERALMIALIPLASEYATPVLSRFHVGAVGKTSGGNLYFGANLEFASGPLSFTVHAEQAVVMNAMSHMESDLDQLAISAAPCGYCRQFLYELDCAERLSIVLDGQQDRPLMAFLPGAFGPADLNVSAALMKSPRLDLSLATETENPLEAAACEAACHAYVPYTKSASGVAVRVENGDVYCGSQIENAAFNPSVLPLQMALSQLHLARQDTLGIREIVQVSVADSQLDHATPTRMMLQGIAPEIKLQTAFARFSRNI